MAATTFREEALRYQGRRFGHGDLLRITPTWIRWSYRAAALATLAAVIYLALARVDEYASGPALVRVEGRTTITAKARGIVQRVAVRPGQKVKPGQVLVSFLRAEEEALLSRVQKELDSQLTSLLLNPTDAIAKQAVATLVPQRDLAHFQVNERDIKAPLGGIVSEVRIREGQRLEEGEIVLSVVADGNRGTMLAMLPGHSRPALRVGEPLRLRLTGYSYAYTALAIASISDQIIGPSEVRRYIGPELADTIELREPVVLVTARLPKETFEADGQAFAYFDGMPALAEARIRKERLLFVLVPALKGLLGRAGG